MPERPNPTLSTNRGRQQIGDSGSTIRRLHDLSTVDQPLPRIVESALASSRVSIARVAVQRYGLPPSTTFLRTMLSTITPHDVPGRTAMQSAVESCVYSNRSCARL